MILEIIVKYWIEVLLGLVCGALGFACKRIYKLYKDEQNHQKTKEQKAFYKGLEDLIKQGAEESRRADEELRQDINVLKDGVLSIQKKSFKQECRELLREGHKITIQEFDRIQEEHNTYKHLGGNHDGDEIFEIVVAKATKDMSDSK